MIALDLRSLAALRIGTALILLFDLIERFRTYDFFYSENGVLPRAVLFLISNGRPGSVHHLSTEPAYFYGLLAIQVFFAGLLLVGYRTRLVTFFSWTLIFSLQQRNPAVWHTADLYLRLLLFWQIFLPTASVWSIDARKNPPVATMKVFGVSTAALLFQVMLVYVMTAWYKSANLSQWWTEATMLSYTTALEVYMTPLGSYLHHFPALLRTLTRFSFLLEYLGPVLLVFSFCFPRLRTGLVLVFIGFHYGTSVIMEVGQFPWVSIAAWLAFLPTEFWARVRAPPVTSDQLRSDRLPIYVSLIVFVSMAYVLSYNYQQRTHGHFMTPVWLERYGKALGLEQSWSMFSGASISNGWLVIPGRFSDGKELDLLTMKPVTWERPSHFSELFPTDRHRTYSFRITGTGYGDHRGYYADYFCRRYRAEWPHLLNLRIVYMELITVKVGDEVIQDHSPDQRELLTFHCPQYSN